MDQMSQNPKINPALVQSARYLYEWDRYDKKQALEIRKAELIVDMFNARHGVILQKPLTTEMLVALTLPLISRFLFWRSMQRMILSVLI